MNCKIYIDDYLKCMKQIPINIPCDDKCKNNFYIVIKCLEENN